MKSQKLIICGVPRAWKSTLARKIAQKFWLSHIPLDPLMTAFHMQYPESGITLSMSCYTTEYKRIARTTTHFLLHYIKSLDKEVNGYVLEWFHMDIDMLYEFFWKTHTILVMWYPSIVSADKLKAIRQYDTSIHRTYVLEQTELARQVEWFIDISKWFAEKAKTIGVQFLDTSSNHKDMIEEFVTNY